MIAREASQFVATFLFLYCIDEGLLGSVYIFFVIFNLVTFYILGRLVVETYNKEAGEILIQLRANLRSPPSFLSMFEPIFSCTDLREEEGSPLLSSGNAAAGGGGGGGRKAGGPMSSAEDSEEGLQLR